jgi:hypothetical protein
VTSWRRLVNTCIASAAGLLGALSPSSARAQDQAPDPATVAPRPNVFVSGDWRFSFHGIAGASVYVQDTAGFAFNGQGLLLPLDKPSNAYTTGVDVRQTRLTLGLSGPTVLGGATPSALVETDFFGPYSPGSYGEVSITPRLRLGYAELNWGHDVIRVGQDLQLLIGFIPESLGHLGFPVTAPAGLVGWREPGVTYFHTFDLPDESKLEISASVMRSDWSGPVGFGQTSLNNLNVDYGQLSGWPGVEARVKWTTGALVAFVAGHYNRVEGTHAGELVNPPQAAGAGGTVVPQIPTRDWDVFAGQAGVRVHAARWTVYANAYLGQNTAPLQGELTQFIQTNDVREWGAWGQALVEVVKGLDVSCVAGTTQLQKSDVEAGGGGHIYNSLVGGMVRYKEGGFAVGPEYFHVVSRRVDASGAGVPSGAGAPSGTIIANQFMLSGMYFF